MAKAKSLETAFEELDALAAKMEDRDLPLEEAFKLYQEGVKLLKYCNGAIDKVEKKIIEIHGNEDEEDEYCRQNSGSAAYCTDGALSGSLRHKGRRQNGRNE